jgi:sec-independent protein translocase protein TatA
MGFGSPVHWLILAGLAILVLGGGRFSNMMGDVARGIKQFKKGMAEEDEAPRTPSRIDAKPVVDPTLDREATRVRDGEI